MGEKIEENQSPGALARQIDALLSDAETGGALALQAARQAAALSAHSDPARFRRALTLAANLDPLNAAPRLSLARRLGAEGDLDGARREANVILGDGVDQAGRAEASLILGEIARVRGEFPTAREHFETAATIDDLLLRTNPLDRNATQHYARALGRISELDAKDGAATKARTGADAALRMLHALAIQSGEDALLGADIADAELRFGVYELDSGAPSSAREHFAEAIKRYEALILHEPDEPHWRAVLADAWALAAEAALALGAADPARHAIDKAMALRTKLASKDPYERWALAGVWRQRAALLSVINDPRGASLSLNQARLLIEQMRAEEDSDEAARFHVHTLLEMTDHALAQGDLSAAHEAAEAAREQTEPFAQTSNTVLAWRADLAAIWERLGDVARAAKATGKAQEAFARAVELRRLALERQPDANHLRRGLASSLLKAGDGELEAGAVASARAAYAESASLRLRLTEEAPDDVAPAHALAVALERVGVAALAAGDARAARAAWQEELALSNRIYAENDADGLRFRAVVEAHLAELGGLEAEVYRTEAVKKFDTLARHMKLSVHEEQLRQKLWRS